MSHYNVLDTYRLINEVFLVGDDIDKQVVSSFSLTVRQYHLLNWLSIRGQASLSELADLLLCDKSNVTGIARRLFAAGMIEKVANADRRFTYIRLTEAGEHVRQEAATALRESILTRFGTVPDDDHEQLQQLLVQVHHRLRSYRDAYQKPVRLKK